MEWHSWVAFDLTEAGNLVWVCITYKPKTGLGNKPSILVVSVRQVGNNDGAEMTNTLNLSKQMTLYLIANS